MDTIIKRDGRIAEFNRHKIEFALQQAFLAVDESVDSVTCQATILKIVDSIEQAAKASARSFTVEEIQDLVERKLMASSRKDVARAYITYRNERTRIRERNSKFRDKIREKVYAKNVQNQNANVDEYSFGGRRGEADSVVLKDMALDELVKPEFRALHDNNKIYIHDLDSYVLGMHNCLTMPLDRALNDGVDIKDLDLRSAGCINTAMQLVAVLFQTQSLMQFGGVSAGHIDWTMVPFVRKSFYKHFSDGLKYINGLDIRTQFNANIVTKDTSIDDDHYKMYSEAYQYAMDMTERETRQAAEGMTHNLNSLLSRSGNQLPFSSINYGTCTLPEGRMVTRAILEASIDGIGKFHKTSIFPCGIFQYKKGINDKPGTPNYDLKRLALKSTAKRLYPNYANCDWSAQKSWVKLDRGIKDEVISSLKYEVEQSLIQAITKNPELGEYLFLEVKDGKLQVVQEEQPSEMFSTMGALAGHEMLAVKIDGQQSIMSIKELYDRCCQDEHFVNNHANSFDSFAVNNGITLDNNIKDVKQAFDSKPGVYSITYLPCDTSAIYCSRNVRSTVLTLIRLISSGSVQNEALPVEYTDSNLSHYLVEELYYSDTLTEANSKIDWYRDSAIKPDSTMYDSLHAVQPQDKMLLTYRPDIKLDSSVSQDIIDISNEDIKVLDVSGEWIKVNKIFKNDAANSPLMMNITYTYDDKHYSLCCTEDHPLLTDEGFIRADELSEDNKLLLGDITQFCKVESISWFANSMDSYDIATQSGTFVGSNIAMHNCRTANGADVNFNQDYYRHLIYKVLDGDEIDHLMLSAAQKDGRGNICPTTIILPTLAMECEGTIGSKNVDQFITKLDFAIRDARDMLIDRYDWICSQDPKSAKFMYNNNMMSGYIPEDGIESALKHGTLAIGQLGLAETLQILIGCDHTDQKGMELAKRIESLFNKRCAEFKKKFNLNFGVYYTPAENLAYTAMNKFKAQYGEIPKISDKDYFTNSMHVPVWKNMSPFDKIDIESQLTGFSNAGCITYVELDGSAIKNIDAIEEIVDYAMDKDIPYFAINVPADSCQDCGYQGEFNDKCPKCGSSNIQQLRRVTGYLTGDYKTRFNLGKQAEAEARVKHVNKMTSLNGEGIE